MSRNILACGLLVTGLVLAGCSSSSKSRATGDGSSSGVDLVEQTGAGDAPAAGGADRDAEKSSLPENDDATTSSDTVRDSGIPGQAEDGPGDLARDLRAAGMDAGAEVLPSSTDSALDVRNANDSAMEGPQQDTLANADSSPTLDAPAADTAEADAQTMAFCDPARIRARADSKADPHAAPG